ncbi:MAG: 30S ribosomal protein S18 [Patescibacteria group bacterium]|nr:30S ribosomal protein S18 [Patescibacteria group bacterium]
MPPKTTEQYYSPQFIRVDYKDTELLKKFLNPHGKIMPRRRTGLSAPQQRMLSQAIKRARFMALLPYIIR